MSRCERRRKRKAIFAEHKAKYHAGYFAGTRAATNESPEGKALTACHERGVGPTT